MLARIQSQMKTFLELGALFGASIVLWYCLHNVGYLPNGLTLGDTLYLVAIFFIFGFVYIFIVALLVSLGNLLVRMVGWLTSSISWDRLNDFKNHINNSAELGSVLQLILPAILGAIVIFGMSTTGVEYGLYALVTSIAMSYFAVGYLQDKKLYQKCVLELEQKIQSSGDSKKEEVEKTRDRVKRSKLISAFAVFLLPLLTGGMSQSILNGAMALSHLRENLADVYVQQEYCDIAKVEFPTNYSELPSGRFCKLGKMAVLFNGIGANTVVALTEDSSHFLPIPTKSVVVRPLQISKSH